VVSTLRLADVTFLHWAVEPSAVAPLLPAGVEPDTIGDTTYVGLVGLRMAQVGVLHSPGIPYLGSFPQTNVRLYSVDRLGRRGVAFCSMDAARLLPVLAGRATGLPCRWSRMTVRADGACRTYITRRRQARSVVRVEVGGAAEPTPLDDFLTARWGLHVRRAGRLWHLPIEHPAWGLRTARVVSCRDELVAAAGILLPQDQEPVSVLWSPGVPARFGRPEPVS